LNTIRLSYLLGLRKKKSTLGAVLFVKLRGRGRLRPPGLEIISVA
jgi:hypothetical protein